MSKWKIEKPDDGDVAVIIAGIILILLPNLPFYVIGIILGIILVIELL